MVENIKKDCGIIRVMDIFGGKWKLEIMWQVINNDGIRFNQLKRNIPKITNVMLNRCLITLIENEFIQREDKKTIPPHVEYYFTEKANKLIPILKELSEFGEREL